MSKAVIINGGNSKESRLTGIQKRIESFFETESLPYDTIYVHDLPAEDLIKANFSSEAIIQANQIVKDADIVVVLTPVYKASFTGILKTYLDLLPQKILIGKSVLPIAIGGSLGHLLVIEYALKPVLSELGATEILKGVFVVDEQIKRLDGNEFLIAEEAENRLNDELKHFQNQRKVIENRVS
jgi:FMN reductase